jgi:hypothetical protein
MPQGVNDNRARHDIDDDSAVPLCVCAGLAVGSDMFGLGCKQPQV